MIKILGYGSGNVRAITNIYSRLNIPCEVAQASDELETADKIIVPGVGAFDLVMSRLSDSGMLETLNRRVLEDRVPVLGVCVGMQVMGASSDEGELPGLGWIDGRVRGMDVSGLSHKPKLPHMGWNSIAPRQPFDILSGVDPERGFYFLHSFCFDCTHDENVLATATYGQEFSAAIVRDNIFGFQFHPEKSHSNGIAIFKNFAGF